MHFNFGIFLFLSYSFGIKAMTTFIRSRGSLENHTRFRTNMGKVYTLFQTKKAQKPYPKLYVALKYCLVASTVRLLHCQEFLR